MTVEGMSPAALAERYVIGALMGDPSTLRTVQVEVVPRDFEDQRLGVIYAGILRMAAAGEPIDYLAVSDHLREWDVRGIDLAQLAGWVQNVPTFANVAYHARMVRDNAVRLRTRQVAESLLRAENVGPALIQAITDLVQIRDRDLQDAVAPVRTLRDILSVPAEEDVYDWVIPDVVERKDRMMLTASEGLGKSVLLRQMAVLPAAGIHPFRFSEIPPIRTLILDVENSERQWRRSIRRMAEAAQMQGLRDPQDNVYVEFLPKSDITKAVTLGAIHRRIDEVEPDLVVVGPLYRMAPSMNDDDDASPVLEALDSIRERNVAMLIEAHAGHGVGRNGERNLRPRGSSAQLGWPEFGIGLAQDKELVGGEKRYRLVRWRGDRDARKFPPVFRKGQMWPWEPAAAW